MKVGSKYQFIQLGWSLNLNCQLIRTPGIYWGKDGDRLRAIEDTGFCYILRVPGQVQTGCRYYPSVHMLWVYKEIDAGEFEGTVVESVQPGDHWRKVIQELKTRADYITEQLIYKRPWAEDYQQMFRPLSEVVKSIT